MSADKSKQQKPAIWRRTTTNPNRNGNNEETASSAGETNRNSAIATATIRARSPRKMKTQIAKLVYDTTTTTTTKSNRDILVNEKKIPAAAGVVIEEDFQKKRQDRDREVKEIHEMLNEITNTPTKEEKDAAGEAKQQHVIEKIERNSPTKKSQPVQRSKTETNLRQPTARRSQLSLQPKTARSKSVQNRDEKENSSPPKKGQKAYNSEEARRYMQEQKKKRKSLQTATQGVEGKPAIDRDEIKKRLDNLRKNTRQIVNKNVNMAKKKGATPTTETKKAEPKQLDPIPVEEKPSTQQVSAKDSQIESTTVRPLSGRSEKKKTPEKPQDVCPLTENYKKVGLLRKPEFKDHSFSAIKDMNMDKENLFLDIITPHLLEVPSSRLKNVNTVEPKKPEAILVEKRDKSLKSDSSTLSSIRSSVAEMELKIPDAKLRPHLSLREKSVQVDRSVQAVHNQQQPKNAELPYWLKPTAAQAYPYNFIMAVRKKLEAIASPPAVATSSLDHQQPKRRSSSETPVPYPKSTKAKRRLLESEDKTLSKENLTEHRSEFTSNFSSISINLPDSDTISSLKSKGQKPVVEQRKPLRFDEDDTTVSSSVFSSPEKRRMNSARSKNRPPEIGALSPLSVENISNLHIQSKSKLTNVTLSRGDSSFHRKPDHGTNTTRSEGSVDFSQLLDDFNRSLSQVIEVNHQLKTTLVKSHQIFSPEKNKRPSPATTEIKSGKSIELAEYVSDFEESSIAAEPPSKESNVTLTNSSIPEIHTASNRSSEAKTTSSSNGESPIQSSSEDIPSQGRSLASLETQTFIVSSEDTARDSPRTQTIHEEAIEESPNKDNMSANQYSRDSLEMEVSPRRDYIQGHINTSRGDFQNEASEQSAGPPPSYKATSKSQDTADRSQSNFMSSSLDSEFVRVFNKSDLEISVLSLNRSVSESTINYSSIGLYEKLIQNETNKSEHLAALLKMREKALMDRTKGQIAWLEVQKERYKAKGLTFQISAVKKKQRGILLKMEKEREEIKKLLQQAKVQRDHKLRIPESRPSTDVTLLQQRSRTRVQTSAVAQAASVYQPQKSHHLHHHQQYQAEQSVRSKPSAIVRGYELETSRSLEQFLHKREEDLRRRREHVERLMEWHRRLDQEEAEVLQLERMLLDYNNVHVQQENAAQLDDGPNHVKMEKKLKEIDRSLRELSSISGGEASADGGGGGGDFVRTTGSRLNKLWRRLTSRRVDKFEPNKKYKLCKADLEQLYEEAKLAVLHDFGDNVSQMEVFLGQTSISTTQPSIMSGEEVPHLNLNFSSGQSDTDMVRGNYSPSAAEDGFIGGSSTEESGRENSKGKTTSGSSTHSALPSLLESDHSSTSKRREQINRVEISASETNSPARDLSSTSSAKAESNCAMKITPSAISVQSAEPAAVVEGIQESLPQIPLNSASSATIESGSTGSGLEAIDSQESVLNIVLNSGSSNSLSRNDSFLQNSRSASTAPETESNRTRTDSAPKSVSLEENSVNSRPSVPSALNSVASAVSSRSNVPTAGTESNRTSASQLQNSKSNVSTSETESELPESTFLSVSIAEATNTLNSVEAEFSQSKCASNDDTTLRDSTPSESVPQESSSNGGSQSVHTRSGTTTISHRDSLPESASGNKLNQHSQSRTSSNYTNNRSTDGSATTSSIVKSLLQCSNGTVISENSAIAELSRMSSKSEKEIRALTNGHDQLEDFESKEIPSQSELNDETCPTLRSINSIDNSTNSKHSTHFATTSHSSKPKSPSTTESNETTPSHRKTSDDASVVYSTAFDYSDGGSNQHRSSVIMSTGLSPIQDDDSKTLTNAFYESDFTDGEESNIDNVSLPQFETTGEEEEENRFLESVSNFDANTTDLEKRLIDLDGSLKDLNATFEKALSPEKTEIPPHDSKPTNKEQSDSALMPDIISEVELRRRQQVMLENEMKQFEHAVPYMYVREIPNKPPPPYVPPAHGSPMTTIFPSEERIKDITYRRTNELYHEILNIDTTDDEGKKPPSVLDENITNIYERIILDICKEYLTEYEAVLTSADPNNFHSALAFFNPPDRLKCMQDFIYKEVRKSLAMDRNSPKRNQVYSVYGHRGKRDHIGEIIIQEMFEEDDRWSNFYVEEAEVVDLIIEEMIGAVVRDIATEVLEEEVPRDSFVPLETESTTAVVRCNST